MAVGTKGYRELLRACDRAGRDTRREVRSAFREVGEVVRVSAASRFARFDQRSAAGYRVVVRQRGVSVEQRLRRTTGRHPEFGALQMREALIPAAEDHADTAEDRVDRAIEKVVNNFEH